MGDCCVPPTSASHVGNSLVAQRSGGHVALKQWDSSCVTLAGRHGSYINNTIATNWGWGGAKKVPTAMHLLQENWELFQNGWSRFGQPAHPFPLNSPEQQFQPVLHFAFFARERCDCGGIDLQREQSRTVAANLKLAVGRSAFRGVKDGADISNVFGRAELWFHSEHFSWFALSLAGVNGLDAERLQSATARVWFCSLQKRRSYSCPLAGSPKRSVWADVIPVYCKCHDSFFLVLTFPEQSDRAKRVKV